MVNFRMFEMIAPGLTGAGLPWTFLAGDEPEPGPEASPLPAGVVGAGLGIQGLLRIEAMIPPIPELCPWLSFC